MKGSNAQVVELVDTQVSEACASRHAGSSPALGTNLFILHMSSVDKEDGDIDSRSMVIKHGVFLAQLMGVVAVFVGASMFFGVQEGLFKMLGGALAIVGVLFLLLPLILRSVGRRRGGKISRDFKKRMEYTRMKYKQEFDSFQASRTRGKEGKSREDR